MRNGAMGLSENYGKTMENPWKSMEQLMEKLWKSLWKNYGQLWRTMENMIDHDHYPVVSGFVELENSEDNEQ